ncbi:hypothetical protein TruAng_004231 [Truncatella angustata]|nr:hypothetical protein TruAng_004231 [Truncatella angustata]
MKSFITYPVLGALVLAGDIVAASRLQRRQEAVTVTHTVPAPQASTTAWSWNAGGSNIWPIHESCNATEKALLKRGLDEAATLAGHAKDHVLRFGNSSDFYQKYFGSASTGEVIGWFDKIANGDRSRYKFRCDNPDGNCVLPAWGGHWRGENATEETVICPLSYETRKPLDGLCGYGYTVASGALNVYFASDLIHRLFHMPSVGEGVVEHYADTYTDCLELATSSPEQAVRNTHTLQYFALDVYAFDIALPNDGCTGKAPEESSSSAVTSAPASPTEATSTNAAVTATTADDVTTTASAGAECHTHSNGDVHCS